MGDREETQEAEVMTDRMATFLHAMPTCRYEAGCTEPSTTLLFWELAKDDNGMLVPMGGHHSGGEALLLCDDHGEVMRDFLSDGNEARLIYTGPLVVTEYEPEHTIVVPKRVETYYAFTKDDSEPSFTIPVPMEEAQPIPAGHYCPICGAEYTAPGKAKHKGKCKIGVYELNVERYPDAPYDRYADGSPKPAPRSSRRTKISDDIDPKVIRTWLRENGYEVGEKGRVPASLKEIFMEAHIEKAAESVATIK